MRYFPVKTSRKTAYSRILDHLTDPTQPVYKKMPSTRECNN